MLSGGSGGVLSTGRRDVQAPGRAGPDASGGGPFLGHPLSIASPRLSIVNEAVIAFAPNRFAEIAAADFLSNKEFD
jgi:hypothetical protein